MDRWAQKDERFTVIHQENGGVSKARNAGIQKSSGEYITFCDSDDRIKENFVLEAVQYLNHFNLDTVIGSWELIDAQTVKKYQCVANNGNPWIFGEDEDKGIDRLLDHMISGYYKENNRELGNILTGRVCCKVFRKEILQPICFHPKINLHEDNMFSIQSACMCQRIGVVDNIWYEYHMNPYSATHKKPKMREIENEFIFSRELYRYRKSELQNAVDVRMIWNMKSICSILRHNKEMKKVHGKIIQDMLREDCFSTAIRHFDLSGYHHVKRTEIWFSLILKAPAAIRKKLLYLWTSI